MTPTMRRRLPQNFSGLVGGLGCVHLSMCLCLIDLHAYPRAESMRQGDGNIRQDTLYFDLVGMVGGFHQLDGRIVIT